jgi:hypothetical protein
VKKIGLGKCLDFGISRPVAGLFVVFCSPASRACYKMFLTVRMPQTRRRSKYSAEVRRLLYKYQFWKQQGGATIETDGVRYDYRTTPEYNSIVIRGGRTAGRRECFLLIVEKDKTALLHSLKQAEDCSLEPGGTGKTLVKSAVALAKKNRVVSLTLADDSKKRLPNEKVMRLSNLYFLTTGQTWYESLIPGLRPTEKAALIERWRTTVRSNTWESIGHVLPVPPVSIADIDTTAPGSAITVLQRIKQAGTDYFADNEDDILNASKIGNLHGIEWITTDL